MGPPSYMQSVVDPKCDYIVHDYICTCEGKVKLALSEAI